MVLVVVEKWVRAPGDLPEMLTLPLLFQEPSSAQNTPGTASL